MALGQAKRGASGLRGKGQGEVGGLRLMASHQAHLMASHIRPISWHHTRHCLKMPHTPEWAAQPLDPLPFRGYLVCGPGLVPWRMQLTRLGARTVDMTRVV